VLAALLQALVQRDEADAALLAPLARPVLRNWNGTDVGSQRPAPALQQLAAALA
jgi:L-asparaginase II